MRLKGKTALISGAGRNNGRAISLAFAREGANLILVARQLGEELNQVAAECESMGVRTLPVLADMSSYEEVNRVVHTGLEHFGNVEISVSVAGIRPHKPMWEYGNDEWQRIFAINVHSTFYLAKALAPSMMQRRSGNFIALAGASALTANPPSSGGSEVATRHSLYGLIKSLALELGPHGIRANLLVLSFIENTRRNIDWYPNAVNGDPHSATAVANSPLGRKGTQEEVANAAVFLASDESSYVTGDRLCCVGGRYM